MFNSLVMCQVRIGKVIMLALIVYSQIEGVYKVCRSHALLASEVSPPHAVVISDKQQESKIAFSCGMCNEAPM